MVMIIIISAYVGLNFCPRRPLHNCTFSNWWSRPSNTGNLEAEKHSYKSATMPLLRERPLEWQRGLRSSSLYFFIPFFLTFDTNIFMFNGTEHALQVQL